jgi:hypothetical protein
MYSVVQRNDIVFMAIRIWILPSLMYVGKSDFFRAFIYSIASLHSFIFLVTETGVTGNYIENLWKKVWFFFPFG